MTPRRATQDSIHHHHAAVTVTQKNTQSLCTRSHTLRQMCVAAGPKKSKAPSRSPLKKKTTTPKEKIGTRQKALQVRTNNLPALTASILDLAAMRVVYYSFCIVKQVPHTHTKPTPAPQRFAQCTSKSRHLLCSPFKPDWGDTLRSAFTGRCRLG